MAGIGAKATTWGGLLVCALMFAVYSRQHDFGVAVVLMTLATLPVAMLNTSVGPILLGVTPRAYLGRAMAVFNPVVELSWMASTILAGWLASTLPPHLSGALAGLHFGRIDTIFAGSAVMLALAGVYGAFALPTSKSLAGMRVPEAAAESVS